MLLFYLYIVLQNIKFLVNIKKIFVILGSHFIFIGDYNAKHQ